MKRGTNTLLLETFEKCQKQCLQAKRAYNKMRRQRDKAEEAIYARQRELLSDCLIDYIKQCKGASQWSYEIEHVLKKIKYIYHARAYYLDVKLIITLQQLDISKPVYIIYDNINGTVNFCVGDKQLFHSEKRLRRIKLPHNMTRERKRLIAKLNTIKPFVNWLHGHLSAVSDQANHIHIANIGLVDFSYFEDNK